MKTPQSILAIPMLAAAVLAGCASPNYSNVPVAQPYPQQYPQQTYPVQTYPSQAYGNNVGTVDSIYMNQSEAGNGTGGVGVGAVVGGVVGGLLGNQVGGGRGKKAATVAGVVGGAMVGHEMEQRNSAPRNPTYQVGVRLDNGAYRTLTQESVADLQVGSRVRTDNNRAYRY